MKYLLPFLFILISTDLLAQKKGQRKAEPVTAPTVDSIFVNLYTDSLKKGTYNYINVDGKLSNGRYLPLDTSKVVFTTSDGSFHGNSLWIGQDFKKEKVTITVTLKEDKTHKETLDIYIKTMPDPDLKTEREVLDGMKNNRKNRRG